MITNVEFNNPKKGAIRTYARYMMSPKAQEMPYDHSGHTAGNERLEAVYCNGLTKFDAQKGQRSINKSCRDFEAELREWNKTWKQGQKIKDTSNQCVIGTISFGEKDKVTAIDALAKAQECVSNVMPGTRLALFTVHGDSNVFHVHFEVSVVDMETGRAYAPQGEYRAMYNQWELENERMELAYPAQLEHVQQREAVAIQERKAGLETTRNVQVKQLTHKTHQKLFKRGMDIEEVPEADLRSQFTLAYRESGKDFNLLLDNLAERGIQVIPNMGVTSDKISGLSIAFKHDLTIRTGLGKYGDKYKWSNLSKELNYDNEQHRGRLIECKEQAEALKHRPQTTGMDGQDSRELGQPDQHETSGLGTTTSAGTGPRAFDEETPTRGVETINDGHIGPVDYRSDGSNKHDLGRSDTSLDGPHRSHSKDLETVDEATERFGEIDSRLANGIEDTTTETIEGHSLDSTGNTHIDTGSAVSNLATDQGNASNIVFPDQIPEPKLPLTLSELLERHTGLESELEELKGLAERGNLTDFWDPYTKQTLGDKLAEVQAAYDSNLEYICNLPKDFPTEQESQEAAEWLDQNVLQPVNNTQKTSSSSVFDDAWHRPTAEELTQ